MIKTILFLFIIFFNSTYGQEELENTSKDKRSDIFQRYYERVISKYEELDKKKKPEDNQIVAVGSSSIGYWEPTIVEDLKPLDIFSRSLNGGGLSDVLDYADKLILKYKPRAVLVYAGENDLVSGSEPAKVLEVFKELVKLIKKENENIRIYFISVKPSVGRWYLWNKMKQANILLEEYCKTDKNLKFIDIANPMLNEEGKPKPELYRSDTYHLSDEGYKIWTAVIKPILIASEESFILKAANSTTTPEPPKK